jgi:hypothetical protein
MNRVSKIPLLTLLCVLVASATPAQAKMEKLEETVVMSDGTGLDARIFKPEGAGAWPALLVRTPYSSESAGDALVWVDAGAVFVKQNVRGQGLSDGEFCLMLCDGQDGVETIDWITRQSWSNAEVVMVGNSVSSFTQYMVAPESPEGLRALTLGVASASIYDVVMPGGSIRELDIQTWAISISQRTGGRSWA